MSDATRKKMRSRAKLAVLVGAVVFMAFLLFGGDFGLITLYRYNRFEKALEKQIAIEEARRDSLEKVLEKLKSDEVFIEKLAREKLRMVKEGEKIYRFDASE